MPKPPKILEPVGWESPPAMPAPPAPPAPIQVTIRLERMHAVATTDDEDRDEVYILAWTGGDGRRLPSLDDYYEAYRGHHLQDDGWTGQDETPLGTPVLWSGTLAPGEQRTWYAVIGEQDNGGFPVSYKNWTSTFPPVVPDPRGIVAHDIHNTGHQVIGGFRLIATNADGRLRVDSWEGGPFTACTGPNPETGPNAAYFVAHGDGGSQYNFIVNIVVTG